MQIYEVKTRNGVIVRVEAINSNQAEQRARSPLIIKEFVRLLHQSLDEIASVQPLRGPNHSVRSLVFADEFFNNM